MYNGKKKDPTWGVMQELDVNHLMAKVCMKELGLILPFIDFNGYYDIIKWSETE